MTEGKPGASDTLLVEGFYQRSRRVETNPGAKGNP